MFLFVLMILLVAINVCSKTVHRSLSIFVSFVFTRILRSFSIAVLFIF
jgi:hypothetical protein